MSEIPVWKKILSGFLYILHIVLVLLLLFGWLIPSKKLWIFLAYIFIPFTIISWSFFNGCILTKWQNELENKQPSSQPGFIQHLLDPDNKFSKKFWGNLENIIIILVWMITFYRICPLSCMFTTKNV